ncbi:hypothetical protein [Coprococcus sp. OM06-25]|nr:hypothetical protein [Coprococcus sp. OM06-25]
MRLSQNSGVPIYQQIADSSSRTFWRANMPRANICRLSGGWHGI